MPRIYSRGACSTCKRRKKKCDERKPACNACTQLSLKCSYDYRPATSGCAKRGLITLGRFELKETYHLSRSLQTWSFRNDTEANAIWRAPASVLAFYGPLCSEEIQDLRLIWQIASVDKLIRDATIACFSVVWGRTPRHGKLNPSFYCSALKLVRERVTHQLDDVNDLLILQITVFFLGLMDSVGPDQPLDLHLHWRGLAQLLALVYPGSIKRLSLLQKNIFILALESAAYHLSCQMLFVEDANRVWKLWRETRIWEMLEETNPKGPERIARSPILGGCGDYIMYDLVVQLTHLSRSSGPIADSRLDDIESVLHQLEISLTYRFAQYEHQEPAPREVYRMFLGSLFIKLIALRQLSKERSRAIDCKAIEVFKAFSKIRSLDMNHAPTSWPVQVLACAIRLECDFERFKHELTEFKLHLDPGHTKRLEAVVEEIECVRLAAANMPRRCEIAISPALRLLRKPGGMLS